MTYEPQVDDYVIWKRPSGDWEEGWVYFKGDPVDNEKRVKQGWNEVSQYITIETHVYPKKECRYTSGKPMRHKNIHCLLICNKENWKNSEIRKNPFFCPDKKSIKLWEKYLLAVKTKVLDGRIFDHSP